MAKTRLRKVFAMLLAASMTISMVTAGVAAVENDPDETGAVALESVTLPQAIEVAYGTELEDVLAQLPGTLAGTVAGEPAENEEPAETEEPAEAEAPVETEEPAEVETLSGTVELTSEPVTVPVTWSCGDYDGWTAGAYTFTAALGEGYTYGGSLDVTVTVAAQTAAVAQIGETTYATLDEAVEQAAEGDTIELLANCKLDTGFNKSLTFTGDYKIRIDRQLTSNGEGWMCFGLYNPTRVLTFDGVEVEWYSEVDTTPWLMLSLSGTLNVTNGAKLMFSVDSGATGSRNAIYMNEGAVINVSNGSTFIINGYDTAGKAGQGIQLDKTGKSSINVTGNSTFLIDGTNRGYVNSPSIYVEDSTFTVQNCTSNASNGGSFTAVNSTVTYQNNAGHGLSAGDVILQNSTLTSDSNGLYGVYVNGDFQVDGTSKLIVTGNSYDGDCAGLNMTAAMTNGLVKSGAVVTITGNFCSGLSNRGTCTFEEGVQLTITDNYNDKGSVSYGGGIYNTKDTAHLVLPSDAVICNNGAVTGGDDIYSTGTITFGAVGAGWVLDDCGDAIDGWYQDGAGSRWSAHSTSLYAYEFTGYGAAVTSALALKAAYGLAPVEPGDPEAPQWAISKSKTATNLDASYESQVTLSLPAADTKGDLDVAFVLDGSTSSDEDDLAGAAAELLDTLSAYENLDVKVGVVIFGGYVPVLYNSGLLTLSDADNVTALQTALTDKSYADATGRSGSNLQAGVEAAQAMLDGDTAVDAADKYLIILSDGAARMWYEDGQAVSQAYYPFDDSTGDGFWWNSNSDFVDLRYGGGKLAPGFAQVWSDGQSGKDIGAYGLSYEDKESGSYTADDIAPYEVMMNGEYYTTYEAATYYAATAIVEAAQKNQVIFVTYGYHDETNYGQYIESFKAWLADNGIVTRYNSETLDAGAIFSAVKDELIQLVDAGSRVVDVIGYGGDYNFDFVNDISKLTLTVNGQALEKTAISAASYGFGGDGAGNYDFVVTYYPDGQGGSADECFVWDINVPVTKDAPVQLTYSVQLTDPETAPGTYGQYDADGSQGYAGLYTNDSAVLYPIDSNGSQGFPERFAKPTVSYTVSGGGPSYDYYHVTVNYYDKATGEKIAESYVSPSRIEGSRYDVSGYDAIAIDGYTYDSTDGDPLTGVLNSNKVVNVYYVADETDIDDGDTPTGDLPDDPGETDIDDGDTPTGDLPDLPDEGGEEVDIGEGDVPTGNLPQTGTMADSTGVVLMRAMSALFLGLALVFGGVTVVLFRKERDQ